MGKRFGALLAIFVTIACMSAALAPAKVTQVKTTLLITIAPGETGGGNFNGRVTANANHFCIERRAIELIHEGHRVGSGKSDKYGNWQISLSSAPPGTYVAKTKKTRLPAALQQKPGAKNAIFCKAAKSRVITVP